MEFNYNRQKSLKVIRALGSCSDDKYGIACCSRCPYNGCNDCRNTLMKDALICLQECLMDLEDIDD